jgi:uncharacterized protein YndB with AHSA1/START domain
MKYVGKLQITTPSDREIAMTRSFDASKRLVFEALVTPELIKRWLLGPDGWSMPVCEFDAWVGGKYRYVWKHDVRGEEMGMAGEVREIVRLDRLVVTELFDEPWYPGQAVNTTTLVEANGGTTMTCTVKYASKDARDGVLKSPMETGAAASYDRLEKLLAGTL